MHRNARTFALAMLFESGLGFAGILIAKWAGIPLHPRLEITSAAVVRGFLACLPMFVLLVAMTWSNWSPFVRLRQLVEQLVQEMFAGSSRLELALICMAAGLGEELLFRGALQPWLATWIHPYAAIGIVGVLFGLAHSMSATYFVAATLIGCYLGWLAEAHQDLIAPIIAHATYDFVALLVVLRSIRKQETSAKS